MIDKKDFKHFLALLSIMSVGFGLFWVFNYNRQIQMIIAVCLAIAYVTWGMVYHALGKELHWRIVLEYVVVAVVVSVIVIFLLART